MKVLDPRSTDSRSAVDSPIPLVGRDAEIGQAWRLVRDHPGLVVVTGARGTGRTRLAQEIAELERIDGTPVVHADGRAGTARERIEAGLRAAGYPSDLGRGYRGTRVVLLAGDIVAEDGDVTGLTEDLATAGLLALTCATACPDGLPAIPIRPLDGDAARELIRLVAPDLADGRVAEVLRISEGRPALILPLADAARSLTDDEALPLPEEVRTFPAGIPDDLGAGSEDVLRWTAVLREPFELSEVTELAGRSPPDVAAVLDELLVREILEEIPPPGPPRFRFHTAVGRAQVRARLRPIERHARCAAVYRQSCARGAEPADLVELAVEAALVSEVVSHSIAAAVAARAAEDPEAALRHALRAIRWWTSDLSEDTRLEAVAERGLALHALSRWREAAVDLGAAAQGLHASGHRDRTVRLVAAAGDSHWKLGERAAALRILDEYLEASADAPPSPDRSALIAQTALLTGVAGQNAASARLAGRARADALACGAPEAGTRALIALGLALVRGRTDTSGLQHLRDARVSASALGAHRLALLALNNEVCGLIGLGRPAEALDLLDEGLELARLTRTAEIELILRTNRGEALLALGRIDDARGELTRSSRGWRRLAGSHLSHAEPYLAWLSLAEGHLHKACENFQGLMDRVIAGQTLFEQLAPLTVGYALAMYESGAPDRAGTAVERALAVWETLDERYDVIPLLAVGSVVTDAEDRRWCDTLEGLVHEASEPALAGFLQVARAGALAPVDHGAARAGYLRAAERFDTAGLAWWSTVAVLWAGRVEESPDSTVDLRTARSRFRAMGAPGWGVRCEALLRARGERVASPGRRRLDRSEPTPRELETLELVAVGLSTRAVAERMVVTEKTVRRHLEDLFATLGVSSRVAAIRVARERGLLIDTPEEPVEPDVSS